MRQKFIQQLLIHETFKFSRENKEGNYIVIYSHTDWEQSEWPKEGEKKANHGAFSPGILCAH
jgi:hypothetical protein